VRLVVTPERMVIDEARRAYTDLCLFEVGCDAVVMNRLLPQAASGEDFFRDWGRIQEERLREVGETFSPLPVLRAPLQEDEVTGVPRLARHGAQVFEERDPGALLAERPRIRFRQDEAGYAVEIPLPQAESRDLDVSKLEDELVVRTAVRRRALLLPGRMARLELRGARLEGGLLVVRLAGAAEAAGA
jgi:arsenite-transporting ATPase